MGASFADDSQVDSIDRLEMVVVLEEAFKLEIPDEDAEKIRPWATPSTISRDGSSSRLDWPRHCYAGLPSPGVGLVTPVGIGTEETWQPSWQDVPALRPSRV